MPGATETIGAPIGTGEQPTTPIAEQTPAVATVVQEAQPASQPDGGGKSLGERIMGFFRRNEGQPRTETPVPVKPLSQGQIISGPNANSTAT